ncbi:MAG: UDP-N-acetylglucosamine 2-epimerase (non-hydrolyzing) [Candidatus Omnitrophota bacterium]
MKKKICIIYGTRPEIIKLSPLIRYCQKKNVNFFCIHTGQHYSYQMDEIFFKELNLPLPKYKLHIKSKAPYMQGNHTGRMMMEIEEILLREMPYCVVVQGDTNTVLAGAMTAEKISTTHNFTGFNIKVAHVEAGLRSYDRNMPEEVNRFIADHLSDFLFAPTIKQKKLLIKEGVPQSWVHVTGNTIVDAVNQILSQAQKNSNILRKLSLKKNSYILLTLHRQENVDSRKIFSDILKGLSLVGERFKLPIVFPIHPRTVKMVKRFNLTLPACIKTIEPTGFLDFIWLQVNAFLVMTDSGGLQEESCILKVPCVTLRNNTERPETVYVGSNIVSGTSPQRILNSAVKMSSIKRNWQNPFGDGASGKRIIKILLK